MGQPNTEPEQLKTEIEEIIKHAMQNCYHDHLVDNGGKQPNDFKLVIMQTMQPVVGAITFECGEWAELAASTAANRILDALNKPKPPLRDPGKPREDHTNCRKQEHTKDVPYMHDADDDTPFDVDGVTYCGRCHRWIEGGS